MVAVGNLKKIWLEIPQDISEKEFKKAFEDYFGAEFGKVLDAVDNSFEYNAYNSAYFSAGGIEPLENLNLNQLLEEKVSHKKALGLGQRIEVDALSDNGGRINSHGSTFTDNGLPLHGNVVRWSGRPVSVKVIQSKKILEVESLL